MAASRGARLAALGFVVLAALLAAGAARQAGAGAGPSRAVVIVGSTPACITFDGSISGIDALELAGAQVISAGFGGLGSGVCAIEGQGCPSSACFQCALPNYWHYFRANSGGSFTASPVGASSTRVEDGDVEAWVWGSTVGPPATVRVDDVCGPAPAPAPTSPPATDPPETPSPQPAPSPSPLDPGVPAPAGTAPSGATDAAGIATDPTRSTMPDESTTSTSTSAVTGEPTTSIAASVDRSSNEDSSERAVADLASDPNLASAPTVDEGADSSVASWIPLAVGLLLVAGIVAWALWRRRTRVE